MSFEPVVLEWLSLIVRWLHVITAMAWVGASFYFMQTDMKLQHSDLLPKGVAGEAWQVHGGNFWNMRKYTVAPENMPDRFTWYLWDSRVTWISGFALLVLVYYMQADLFLIDRTVMDLTPWQAGLFSLVSLVVVWLIYDGLCRSRLGKHEVLLGIIVYLFLVVLSYAFTQVLSGRAAVNQIGAIVGTFMVANAFFMIHPNQRKAVAALRAGRSPDPELVRKARQRSIHNNYLTLPVILLMISNHYPLFYATRYNWVIVAIILALGPVIRYFFNSRNAGKGSPWWTWGVIAAGMLIVLFLFYQGPAHAAQEQNTQASYRYTENEETISNLIQMKCAMCHSNAFQFPGMAYPGGGVSLESLEDVVKYGPLIRLYAVETSAMPPGNITGFTTSDRRQLEEFLNRIRSMD